MLEMLLSKKGMLCHLEGGKGLTNAAHKGACGGVKLLAQPQERKSELRAP